MVSGRRSRYEAKDWICPKCKKEYKPIKCSLIDVPQLECPICNTQNETNFNFNIMKLHKNRISLRTRVYNQGTTGLCALYASKTQAEIKCRVEGASGCWFHDRTIDEEEMLEMYEREVGKSFGEEDASEQGEVRVKRMLHTLQKGVKFKNSRTNKVVKIKEFWRTSKKDFSKICQLLGNGEPLVTYFRAGHNFDELPGNKIYKPPKLDKGDAGIAHAVCLVGAGAHGEGECYQRYLWFRNSYGMVFVLKGDGMVPFSDILIDPFGVTL
uniref:Peptidase C1A papain C-terminal domain-containing protein n=1 Tax=Arundo donax TaxID=35708 RepID=A0A0A9G5W1_ARUDO